MRTSPDGWDDAPFTFVTESVEAAVKQASEQAGDGVVGVAGAGSPACLNAGILDAVRVSLVPYLIGEGPLLRRAPKRPVGNGAITTPTQLSADESRVASRSLWAMAITSADINAAKR